MTARCVITPRQACVALATLAILLGTLWWWGLAAAVIANGVLVAFILIATVWRLAAGILGLRPDAAAPPPVPDASLPSYTILIPMYHEEQAVGGLVEHLACLDYPARLVQVLFLVEEDDAGTCAAARAAVATHGGPDRPSFAVVVVPDSRPRTKPRACNHGLDLATGELLVIYDAEDRPETDQLRKAAAAFAADDANLVCVQARLDCYNRDRTWLTRLFTCEYAAWFASFLPGLVWLRAPVPLGGTSNHMRTAGIRALDGWDAWNVAEDCDLGMRIAQAGLRTRVIDSTTWEEATSSVGTWLRQRSRWCKGWMQTWLVTLRQPTANRSRLGVLGTVQMHLLLGSTVLGQLLTPPCWLLTGLWVLGLGEWLRGFYPPAITAAAISLLVFGNALAVFLSMLACLRRGHPQLVPWCLLLPMTWLLAGIAAWRGVLQLVTRPFHWEKTAHAAGPSLVHVADAAASRPASTEPSVADIVLVPPLRPAPPSALKHRRTSWQPVLRWLLATVIIATVLAIAGADLGPCAILRCGTISDLARDIDRGRQALVCNPWLLPLPTILMLPVVAILPATLAGWAWIAMCAALLAAAAAPTTVLLGVRRCPGHLIATALLVAAAWALGPTVWADLLPALALTLLALRCAISAEPMMASWAGICWAAAAACHPLAIPGATAALIHAVVRRHGGPPARAWLTAIPLAYVVLISVTAGWLVMRDPLTLARAWTWPSTASNVAEARSGLQRLATGELSGRALVVTGPGGHVVADLLTEYGAHHLIDLQPGPVAPWETREAVLLVPTANSPLRRWSDPVDPDRLNLVFIAVRGSWELWAMPGTPGSDQHTAP
jgi:cellulose synthase/poly-beta-1,6-N-acetylglucosamine synthase-like glycosyltransferase